MADAFALGLCHAVGVCDFNPKQLREAHALCRSLGVPLLTNQVATRSYMRFEDIILCNSPSHICN